MIPIIELRGAIPLGIAMDLNPVYLYITCVVGSSIIAVPVVLVFRQVIVFVGVPLPTTGSWSGSALASIFKMRIVHAFFGIFIGNAIAGAIMLTVSMHVAEGSSIELILIALVAIILGLYFMKKRKRNKENISAN
ncbi:hypothetical protein SDC9_188590 [bioreactor metagenome]|uniref:Uncharacterized protein n=1 Tax=bioreactor metagenome TaxID=1076179 RepID=A0A645HQC2_9ZZZZ